MSVSPANAGVADPSFDEKRTYVASTNGFPDKGPESSSEHYEVAYDGPVSFAEYIHYAELRRADEANDTGKTHTMGFHQAVRAIKATTSKGNIVVTEGVASSTDDLAGLSTRDRDLANAGRALRLAGWSTVFYLVMTDILGPFNAGYSVASVGFVPGATLYTLFGLAAFVGGCMLNKIFMRLDSVRYPVKSYGDLMYRVFGTWSKQGTNLLQSLQLIINVGLICLTNGQSLSQVTKGHLCFSVCIVIWALIGMVIGQIRSLQNYSIFSNLAFILNVLAIFLTMGFVAHSGPNYDAATAQGIPIGPVVAKAVVGGPLFAQVNGVFNMVFAYGGAMIFPEIMAEMRRPRDFIKGMALAQGIIFVLYMTFGIYVYAFQGQFTQAVAYQGISKYGWQTPVNIIGLISAIIAAGLYGNIGLKVAYYNIVEGLLRGPPLMTKRGAMLWPFLVLGYWALAFVVGSAIPAVGALSGLVAAMCIFHFTYTFPPLLMLGLDFHLDAMRADEQFSSPGVTPRRIDTWRQLSRWKRGLLAGGRKRLMYKGLNLLFLLAALATDGLGLWATGKDLKEVLAAGAATSFGCTASV